MIMTTMMIMTCAMMMILTYAMEMISTTSTGFADAHYSSTQNCRYYATRQDDSIVTIEIKAQNKICLYCNIVSFAFWNSKIDAIHVVVADFHHISHNSCTRNNNNHDACC